MPKHDIINKLEENIAAELKAIDREEQFDRMLDDCYSFEGVGGPFSSMSPSQVLKEVDPTAHRCGVNDYADGENWVEVDGEYYDQDEAEKVKEELVDEIESAIDNKEAEIEDNITEIVSLREELTEADEEEKHGILDEIQDRERDGIILKTESTTLQETLKTLNDHSF